MRSTPKRVIEYNGSSYKLKSNNTVVPRFDTMDELSARVWLINNTYPKGYQTRSQSSLPNLNIKAMG
jgi:hypothetical protein